MELRTDYSNVSFQNNGKLKLLIIVGTHPEIIRLAAVINKTRQYFDVILAHTGQNYDYNLNGVFFKDLNLKEPEVYMDVVGDDLGSTCGNIINASYKLMVATKPDAVLVLGDTNSCLSVIGAKRLHIPIFHMEAGNRCKDECLPEETNRRIVGVDVAVCYSSTTLNDRINKCLFIQRVIDRLSDSHILEFLFCRIHTEIFDGRRRLAQQRHIRICLDVRTVCRVNIPYKIEPIP